MSKKFWLVLLSVLFVLTLAPLAATAQDDAIVIGFLPGVVYPFYIKQ